MGMVSSRFWCQSKHNENNSSIETQYITCYARS